MDIPIHVAYFEKKSNKHYVSEPILYSELKAKGLSREEMASYFLERCNALGEKARSLNKKD